MADQRKPKPGGGVRQLSESECVRRGGHNIDSTTPMLPGTLVTCGSCGTEVTTNNG